MFGFSFGELLVVGIVALIVFGPEKLPEIARSIGEFSAHFKKGADTIRKEFYNSVYKPLDDASLSVKRGLSTTSLPTPKKILTEAMKDLVAPETPPVDKEPHE